MMDIECVEGILNVQVLQSEKCGVRNSECGVKESLRSVVLIYQDTD